MTTNPNLRSNTPLQIARTIENLVVSPTECLREHSRLLGMNPTREEFAAFLAQEKIKVYCEETGASLLREKLDSLDSLKQYKLSLAHDCGIVVATAGRSAAKHYTDIFQHHYVAYAVTVVPEKFHPNGGNRVHLDEFADDLNQKMIALGSIFDTKVGGIVIYNAVENSYKDVEHLQKQFPTIGKNNAPSVGFSRVNFPRGPYRG